MEGVWAGLPSVHSAKTNMRKKESTEAMCKITVWSAVVRNNINSFPNALNRAGLASLSTHADERRGNEHIRE